jgi:hypothetical protein
VTFPAHADPDLAAVRAAAARALHDRLEGAGWPTPAKVAPVLAEVAVNAAWPHMKHALRPRTEDGR